MGRKPMSTIKLKEVLRLFFSGHSYGQIEKKLNVSKSVSSRYVKRAQALNLQWEQIRDTTEAQLAQLLSSPPKASTKYLEPDFAEYYRQIKLGIVKTVDDAYSDYVRQDTSRWLYSRSWFFQKFQNYQNQLVEPSDDAFFTHEWSAGEFCQIDFSGDGLQIWCEDKDGSHHKKVEIFVAVLPFSRYLFCYAVPDQTRQSWLHCISEMFKYFQGVPKTVMLDNTTALVTKPSRHVPVICSDFEEFARHHKFDPYPVAPYEPTYKGSVENAVGIIQRSILEKIKDVSFFSFTEINEILRREINRLNTLPMKGFNRVTRTELFEFERSYLRPLPQIQFQIGVQFKTYKVGKDYCIRIRGHRYSVPYRYIGKYVNVGIYPNDQLKIFDKDTEELITDHFYWGEKKCSSYVHIKQEHRPPNHMTDQERLRKAMASVYSIDKIVGCFADRVVGSMIYSCDDKKANLVFGIRSMAKRYGKFRLIKACEKALIIGTPSYDLVRKLLETGSENDDYSTIGNQSVMDFMTDHGYLRASEDFNHLINKMRKQ